MLLILIAVAFYLKIPQFIWHLATRDSSVLPAPSAEFNETDLFTWPVLDEFDFEIVGESNYQAAIKQILDPQNIEAIYTALIFPEDDNKYDDKAICVKIHGLTVGYFDKENARSFRRRLATKKLSGKITKTKATITGGHIKDGKQFSYGVRLDLKPFA